MFAVNDIIELLEFTNSNNIEFFMEPNQTEIHFIKKEENEIYRHVYIPIETFNARPMWKNIERLKAGFDIKED